MEQQRRDWILIKTPIVFDTDDGGMITLEGLGLAGTSDNPFRASIGWTVDEEGRKATALVDSTNVIEDDIYIIEYKGFLSFILPTGVGAKAGVIVLAAVGKQFRGDLCEVNDEYGLLSDFAGTDIEPLAIKKVCSYNTNMAETPVGAPIPWISSIVPDGFLAYVGQGFSINEYYELGLLFPNGILPDLRGKFLRGNESARELMSMQGQSVQALSVSVVANGNHPHPIPYMKQLGYYRGGDSSNYQGWSYNQGNYKHNTDYAGTHSHSGTIKGTGSETRPQNRAVVYITKVG